MQLAHAPAAITVTTSEQPSSTAGYLICFDGGTSWRCPLPDAGSLLIGRGSDADVVFGDVTVSRHHARIDAAPDWLEITDLGSRHGTQVNGRPLRGSQALASGDMVAIGDTVLVVRHHRQVAAPRPLLAAGPLRARLIEEIARALPQRGEVEVVCLAGDRAIDAARVWAAIAAETPPGSAAGRSHDDRMLIVAPVASDLAVRLVAAAAAWLPGARAGVARCPADGCDADALCAAASAAATGAAAGEVGVAAAATTTIALGEHQVRLADPVMLRAYDLLRRLARNDLPVLIGGETGTGKELAALAVHHFSSRGQAPFVAINCASLPEALAESELFGHARGAFTGAVQARVGVFEAADGGTLFLDEIGELPAATQAKLLRVLETRRVVRVGEVAERPIDVRVVAATHRDLAADAAAGRFRSDLLYRLGAARVVLPPLRDRPREVMLLARAMLADACARMGRPPLGLTVAAAHALCAHDWPGNVRELRNAMAVAASAAEPDDDELDVWHLPAEVASAGADDSDAAPTAASADGPDFRPIADEVRALERRRMIDALRAAGGQQNRAATLIAMPLRTFVTKLKRYDIRAADWALGAAR